jgi:hypothetical protein
MPTNEGEVVHFFSVHEPGTRSSSFVWLPVEPGHEILTNDEILEYEQGVQRDVHATGSKTAIVKYFALAPKASIRPISDYDPHWDERRIE